MCVLERRGQQRKRVIATFLERVRDRERETETERVIQLIAVFFSFFFYTCIFFTVKCLALSKRYVLKKKVTAGQRLKEKGKAKRTSVGVRVQADMCVCYATGIFTGDLFSRAERLGER